MAHSAFCFTFPLYASQDDLEEFARRIAPRRLIPIRSYTWDSHLDGFEKVERLRDGEPFAIQ